MQTKPAREEITALARRFLDGWQNADLCLDEVAADDCLFDFSMFAPGLPRAALEKALNARPIPVEYADFAILNHVCRIRGEMAVQSFVLFGRYAGTIDGELRTFNFAGLFTNTAVRTAEGWRYTVIRFDLQDEDTVVKPRYLTQGFTRESAAGDPRFVPGWLLRDDRLGWYDDTRLPAVCAELDAPWYQVPEPTEPPSDEEQIRETFWRYAYGIDNYCFQLYDEVFTRDTIINYSDKGCHDVRSVLEYLKIEVQASTRCIHAGYFPRIEVSGDAAEAELFLVSFGLGRTITSLEEAKGRNVWGKYRIRFEKEDGLWKIKDLRFYLADERVYQLK